MAANITLSTLVTETFSKGLKTLTHILEVAEKHAKENGVDANTYLDARLIDDMKPLSFQVQVATNTVAKTISRLQGLPDATDAWTSDETTVEQLHARIKKAEAIIAAADASVIDAKAGEQVDLPFGPQILQLTARESALNQGIPNFYFHVQTAYAILRAQGVPIGKRDYISSFFG
ncbi:hypothetical protein B0T17DRAFT_616653 [Bombardia bombarda]|uniref:DUF1993 domain-containing protein n=1 Tax=Bombardia bombarda TaxID=252184 RepID=A0AA40CAG6_9PEZI|nr:hypothetical protein B0T17DRAFT_616653 [Bombardia bombarda]